MSTRLIRINSNDSLLYSIYDISKIQVIVFPIVKIPIKSLYLRIKYVLRKKSLNFIKGVTTKRGSTSYSNYSTKMRT
ncbi:hypothetical protein BH23THE1_BH23THE1_29140 [soil metagenome]